MRSASSRRLHAPYGYHSRPPRECLFSLRLLRLLPPSKKKGGIVALVWLLLLGLLAAASFLNGRNDRRDNNGTIWWENSILKLDPKQIGAGGTARAGGAAASLFLNDRTIQLSSGIERLWLPLPSGGAQRQPPPAKVLLTNYGWNHPNQTIGLQYVRSARQRELLQGVVDHPWFVPGGWEDVVSGSAQADRNVRYYIFLDVETCFEMRYPKYHGRGMVDVADREGNRTVKHKKEAECYRIRSCSYVPRALDAISHFFAFDDRRGKKEPFATLVLLTCRGDGVPAGFRKKFAGSSLAVASVSSTREELVDEIDQGLPPPAIKPIALTPTQERDIETCDAENDDKRPFLLTFSGAGRGESSRQALMALNNNKDIYTVPRKVLDDAEEQQESGDKAVSYEDLLVKAKFSAAPRGTNLFSYRFTEVLSAGSIPVVHADGWVLPFRKELVHWEERECAVIIPESKANETERILRSISRGDRCRMRKRCYEVYKKYMVDGTAVIRGVIEGLELVARGSS